MMTAVGTTIQDALQGLQGLDKDAVRRHRREKFLAIGRHIPA
jgi:hypothetical protein